jgi:phosphoesterase RecJ-like protein
VDYKTKAQEFKNILKKFKKVSIISHIRPDGDTVGSAIAIYSILSKNGFNCELICKDSNDLPQNFSFLEGFCKYKNDISYKNSLIITVDAATLNRVGFDFKEQTVINIDHHKDNEHFGALNIVDIKASTTMVVYFLFKEIFKINLNAANALYAGLLTDSINFSTSLVDIECFEVAKSLIELGVNAAYISQKVNRQKSLSHIRAKTYALNSLKLYNDAKVAIMILTKQDLNKSGAKNSDIDGIIDEAISLVTVEVALLLVEFEGFIKGSLRSKNEDISIIAKNFGGGGHKSAAGFEVKNGKIEKIVEEFLKISKDLI